MKAPVMHSPRDNPPEVVVARCRPIGFRFVCAVLIGLGALLADSRSSAAQIERISTDAGPSTGLRARAFATYRKGVSAFDEGRYRDAVDLFLAANRLLPNAPLSYNAALSCDRLFDVPCALRLYRDYLRRAPFRENAPWVNRRVLALQTQLAGRGLQQVTVRSDPAGATLAIDGQSVGLTPWTGELAPGKHELSLVLNHHGQVRRTFLLPRLQAIDVPVRLAASAAGRNTKLASIGAEERSVAPTEAQGRRALPWPWIVLGASGISLLAAGSFELLRQEAEDDARAARSSSQVRYNDRLDTMRDRQTAARVFAGVGAGLLVTGGVWFLLQPGDERRRADAALGCGPAGCFGAVKGSF